MIEALLLAFLTPIATIVGLSLGFYFLIKLIRRAIK